MMSHLSEDQISRLVLGKATPEELWHGKECPQCAGDAARFQESIAAFRVSFQEWSHRERVPLREEVSTFLVRPRQIPGASWGWVAASLAIVMLASLPFLFSPGLAVSPSKAAEDARLLEAVNRYLLRPLPAPMEPIMALIPNSESNTFSGEIQ